MASLQEDYPLLRNTMSDLRFMGLTVMNIFSWKTSASRNDMVSSNAPQGMCLEGAEFPYLFHGYEKTIGEHEFSNSRRDQDVVVLDIIPEYPVRNNIAKGSIYSNPRDYVIYRGLTDGKIGYFTQDQYFLGSDKFGHKNRFLNQHLVRVGGIIPKDAELTASPAKDGNKWMLGVNANILYMPLTGTIEDAMIISESLAAKMETTEIHEVIIDIPAYHHPVNVYGDQHEVRFFPDIGQRVNNSNILCAFRETSPSTYAADVDPSRLHEVDEASDKIYEAPEGALVVDVRAYVANMRDTPWQPYKQVRKYLDCNVATYRRIWDAYRQHKNPDGSNITVEFNRLVTDCATHSVCLDQNVPGMARKKPIPPQTKKNTPVSFIQLKITYVITREVVNGFKITGREGGKGVVCEIVPDELMPIDENGVRADIVVAPESPIRRNNEGRRFEQEINRISLFVQRQAAEMYKRGDLAGAFEHIYGWIHDIHPAYAEDIIAKRRRTPQAMQRFVEYVLKKFIFIHIPTFLATVTEENVVLWTDKYGAHASHVRHFIRGADGEIREFRSEKPHVIGSTYLWLLCKVPESTSPGFGHVNHLGMPIKPGGRAKDMQSVSHTPVRYGEDEQRLMAHDGVADEAVRLMGLAANSTRGANMLLETQLTAEFPTRIDRIDISDEELRQTNSAMGTLHHTFATLGIDSRNVATRKRIEDYAAAGIFAGGSDMGADLAIPEEGTTTTLPLVDELPDDEDMDGTVDSDDIDGD